MPERPDYAALIAGQAAVLDQVNSGGAGLYVLDDLLRVAQQALGALGMTFVEHAPGGGRVIAATGACAWALGRPVDPDHAGTAPDARTAEIRVDALPGGLAHQLTGRGLGRVLAARAEVGGVVVGSLQAYIAHADERFDTQHHTQLGYVASSAAHK